MGSVYVFTHPKIPDLVKIGCTGGDTEDAIVKRLKELSAPTGVPGKYQCAGAWTFSKKEKDVEKALHKAFEGNRDEGEFFKIDPECVIAILRQFGRKNVTPGRNRRKVRPKETDQRNKLPVFKFSMVGIEPGETLVSNWDANIKCRVVDDRRVEFEGTTMSLTAAAKIVNKRRGKTYSISGPASWMYGEPPETLSELRKKYS